MANWNGTRLKTSWLRLRGNASGRNGFGMPRPFFCAGCQREHGARVERMGLLDGRLFCNRQYFRYLDTRQAA